MARALRDLLHAYLGNPVAVHLENREAAASVIQGFAGGGNLAEPHQEKSGHGLETAVARQVDSMLRLEIANLRGAFEFQLIGLKGGPFGP